MKGFFRFTRSVRNIWARVLLRWWTGLRVSFFDHRIDELRWPQNIFWVERGALGRLYMKRGAKVLDLCCGDGYYSDVFWSCTAGHIDAVDRNDKALALAKSVHARPNISYHRADIVQDPLPGGGYDVVCFFEAIEHLSADNAAAVLNRIKAVLSTGGVVVGSTTLVDAGEERAHNPEHDHEFHTGEELRDFLSPVFNSVDVTESWHPERRTAYFVCKA